MSGMRLGLAAFAASAIMLSGARMNGSVQDPPAGGLILGQAVDAATQKGVAGVLVSLTGNGGRFILRRALTTPDGHYVFADLPAGSYTISATKTGFVGGGHGMRRPNGSVQPITLTPGERVTNATVVLWRDAVISGTVLDEAGEPIVGLQVQAIARGVVFGTPGLARSTSDVTDDRGAYRIANLVPGDYIICAPSIHVSVPLSSIESYRRATSGFMDMAITGGLPSPSGTDALIVGTTVQRVARPFTPPPPRPDGPTFVYPTRCFPDAVSTDAADAVSVSSGEERPGVDLQIVPVPSVNVSGLVTGPPDSVGALGIRLTPAHDVDSGVLGDSAVTVTATDGTFTIAGVQPGDYVLRIERAPRQPSSGNPLSMAFGAGGTVIFNRGIVRPSPVVSSDPTLWAEQALTVGRTPVNGLTVPLRLGVHISGRIEFKGKSRPDYGSVADIPIVLESVSRRRTRGVQQISVSSSGLFTSIGVPAGLYFVRVNGNPMPGWVLSSIQYEGRDVADTPLELAASDITGVVVTFTDRPTNLGGSVRDQSGSADGDATVLIFPVETAMWRNYGQNPRRLQSLRTGRDGSYSIRGLPAGEYYVTAIAGDASLDWREPDFLERLAGSASRVRLTEAESTTRDLQSREVR